MALPTRAELNAIIAAHEATIVALNAQVAEHLATIALRDAEILRLDGEMVAMNETIDGLETAIEALNATIAARDAEIAALNALILTLDAPPGDNASAYMFDQAEWDAWAAATDAMRFTHRGQPAPVITGYTTVFEDQFLTNTVVDDISGAPGSNWFAPTHLATVGVNAVAQKVNATPSCYIHDAVNKTMSLRLQSVPTPVGGLQWRTGAFSSVNKTGKGRSWDNGIFEIRCKFPALPKPRPGFFPAFWSYDKNSPFWWHTRNRLETDFWEYDGLNGAWINITQHVHAPKFISSIPGVRQTDIHKKIAGYEIGPATGFPQKIDIYDGQFHTWYVQIEDDLTYFVIDGLEVARCPTSKELAAKKYIMVDFAYVKNQGVGDPTQTYDMTIDYIRVRQKV